jgi:hypothetical protein
MTGMTGMFAARVMRLGMAGQAKGPVGGMAQPPHGHK